MLKTAALQWLTDMRHLLIFRCVLHCWTLAADICSKCMRWSQPVWNTARNAKVAWNAKQTVGSNSTSTASMPVQSHITEKSVCSVARVPVCFESSRWNHKVFFILFHINSAEMCVGKVLSLPTVTMAFIWVTAGAPELCLDISSGCVRFGICTVSQFNSLSCTMSQTQVVYLASKFKYGGKGCTTAHPCLLHINLFLVSMLATFSSFPSRLARYCLAVSSFQPKRFEFDSRISRRRAVIFN